MDLGKVKLPIQPYYSVDVPDTVTQHALALSMLDKELAITPGFATLPASAAIAVGDAVAIVGGFAQPADAAGAVPAIGLCVRSAASAGQKAGIILGMGLATGLTGLTANASYYLGNAGAIVVGIPGAGMKQSIGYAVSATELFVTISQPFA